MATTYGVTSTGFVLKRAADIQAEITASLQSVFGAGINLDPRQPLGQIVGIMVEREALVWELAQDVYNSQYPDLAEGSSLDNAVALTGITRKGQTLSTVTATLIGTAGVVIPKGSQVSVAGSPTSIFVTAADATIAAAVNAVQTIAFGQVPTSGTFTITIGQLTTGPIASNAAASDVQTAVDALSGYSGVTVAGSFSSGFVLTFAGTAGGQAQPTVSVSNNTLVGASGAVTTTVTVNTVGAPAQIDVACNAQTPGPIQAPAGSLTVIVTPVSGWTSVTNRFDAAVGLDVETDAELKTRRASSLQISGAGTLAGLRAALLQISAVTQVLIFENQALGVDSNGRPAKSFECVIAGGDDATIAKTIYQEKPLGIQSYGEVSQSVTDSQGFTETIQYTRPTLVPIYTSMDITRSAKFPLNGVTLLQQAVLNYGATLNLGDTIIVSPALVAAINTVPGITNVVIRIDRVANPTNTGNLTMAVTELAVFDTSRMVFNLM